MKNTILFLLISGFSNYVLLAQQSPVPQVKAALEKCYEVVPQEKIYLHTDRSFYSPSETIWFKVYATNAANKRDSKNSPVGRIELLNPKGDVLNQMNILFATDHSSGAFSLPKNSVGGIYKLRAYTNWMRNFGEDTFFEKEITVQRVNIPKLLLKLEIEKESYGAGDEVVAELKMRSVEDKPLSNHAFEYQVQLAGENVHKASATSDSEGKANISYTLPNTLTSASGLLNIMVLHEGRTESIARPIPIQFDNIKLDFLPEGGDLVQNLASKVAFKAVDEFGKSADIEGAIFNEQGEKITTFSSFHDGMGAFEFTPESETYYAQITRPAGISTRYELPKSYAEGIAGRLVAQEEEEVVVNIRSSTPQTLYAVLQMQERVLHTQALQVNTEANSLKIATTDFPMGIARLTIFDEAGLPQWERLVFLNRHRQLKMRLSTSKDSYLPNSKVILVLNVTDSAGKGVQGDFSLAVVDDKLHTYADDKQDDILSYFLMSSELKGKVHEPNFYFNPEEEKAPEALDYVLLTHGWRSFAWKELLAADEAHWKAKVKHPKSILSIKGHIYTRRYARKKIKVSIKETGEEVFTDSLGAFEFKHLDITKLPFTLISKYKKRSTQRKIYSQQLYLTDDGLTTRNTPTTQGIRVGEDIYKRKKAAVETTRIVGEESLSSNPINDLALSTNGGGVSVRGSRTDNTDYFNGIYQEGVSLSEVVVTGIGVQRYNQDFGYGVTARANRSINQSSYDRILDYQDYTFEVGGAPTASTAPRFSISIQHNHHSRLYRNRRFYKAHTHSPNNPKQPETIYWNPSIQTNERGFATMQFVTSSEVSTFRAIIEGIAVNGIPARTETTFNTQIPFNMDAKIPVLLTQGDELELPITFKNTTKNSITGKLYYTVADDFIIKIPDGFDLEKHKDSLNVAAESIETLNLQLKVTAPPGEYPLSIQFLPEQGKAHEIQTTLKVVASTFPRAAYLASKDLNMNYQFEIDNLVEGSVDATFRAIPNSIDEITAGIEGVLREPNGCFEQVSSSNYPNILALKLLEQKQEVTPEIQKKAKLYLYRGYKKLEGYEVEGGGFSLYGKAPARIGLTAFGLIQFHELQKVHPIVNQEMIKRAIKWLLSKRNKDGLFGQGNAGAYQKYGRTSNAYVVYALSTMQVADMETALAHETALAKQDEDIYRLSLLALANANYGKKVETNKLIELLVTKLKKQTFDKLEADATLTRSYGHSKQVELAALATLALCESKNSNRELIEELIAYLQSKKRGAGYFGSTQATALAMQALSKYLIRFAKPTEAGDFELFINDKLVASASYDEETEGLLAFNDLGKHFINGPNEVQVRFANTSEAIPYTLTTNWQAQFPKPQTSSIRVTTELPSEVPLGESVRLTARIHNTSDEIAPTPMAIIGIPSGLSIEVRQVKELVEKGILDYFEIQNNYLVAYYTELGAKATSVIELDLKTQFKGNFQAPPNSAFLYYQSEIKDWEKGEHITIN